jgi:hypothetical protein
VAAAPELEEIIREELREPIAVLVRRVVIDLVREELNGHGPAPGSPLPGARTAQNEQRALGPSPDTPTAAEAAPADALAGRPARSPRTKTCSSCSVTKPLREFARGRRQCKSCRRAYEHARLARRRRIAASANGSEEEPGRSESPPWPRRRHAPLPG